MSFIIGIIIQKFTKLEYEKFMLLTISTYDMTKSSLKKYIKIKYYLIILLWNRIN
jgi:hypothetical protein